MFRCFLFMIQHSFGTETCRVVVEGGHAIGTVEPRTTWRVALKTVCVHMWNDKSFFLSWTSLELDFSVLLDFSGLIPDSNYFDRQLQFLQSRNHCALHLSTGWWFLLPQKATEGWVQFVQVRFIVQLICYLCIYIYIHIYTEVTNLFCEYNVSSL